MSLIQRILSGWTTVKFIRVALGGLILYSSIQSGHLTGMIIGGLFTVMGLIGGGACCAGGACAVPADRKDPAHQEDVHYEEVANK
jgi:hypothetical protein